MADEPGRIFLDKHHLKHLIPAFQQAELTKSRFHLISDYELEKIIPKIVDRVDFRAAIKQQRSSTVGTQTNFPLQRPVTSRTVSISIRALL